MTKAIRPTLLHSAVQNPLGLPSSHCSSPSILELPQSLDVMLPPLSSVEVSGIPEVVDPVSDAESAIDETIVSAVVGVAVAKFDPVEVDSGREVVDVESTVVADESVEDCDGGMIEVLSVSAWVGSST